MKVLSCGKSMPETKKCRAHSHPWWEIIIQKSGMVKSCSDNTNDVITPGDILVIPPGVVHDGKSDEFYSDIYFQADELDFFDFFIVHDLDGSVLTLIKMLHKIMAEKEKDYEIIAHSIAETVCRYIKKYSQTNNHYPFVNEVKNIIYKNTSNAMFDLSAEIEKSGFNEDYFRRCFKKEVGKNPLEYLIYLRINQGKMMLKQDTFTSVENVAHACGFNDSFYFSRCFKKHVGISPLQYRKNYLINRNV